MIRPAEAVTEEPECSCCEECSPAPCNGAIRASECYARCVCDDMARELEELLALEEDPT